MLRNRARYRASDTFPGYADVTEIGRGAFATVYRAMELDTGRTVALKALSVESLPTFVIEEFDEEIKRLGQISDHPHIVTLYRSLTSPEHRAVLVMELCGESAAQRVRRLGPMSAQAAVALAIKMAGALETAHRFGFLHRDLKPQNILTTRFGEPALADFGVAALRASAQATEGLFAFTTLHAPPEVLEGRQLTPATDVYGLASTLYLLLSGRAPFAAFEGEAAASVILRILSQPVTPLRSTIVPLGLSDLLEASLAKDPADRPLSAQSLAERLQELEVACGWPPTPCVAWGETTPAPRAAPTLTPPPPASAAPLPPAYPGPPEPVPAQVRPAAPGTGRAALVVPAAARNVIDPRQALVRRGAPPRADPSPPAPDRSAPPSTPPQPGTAAPGGDQDLRPSPPASPQPPTHAAATPPVPPPRPVWPEEAPPSPPSMTDPAANEPGPTFAAPRPAATLGPPASPPPPPPTSMVWVEERGQGLESSLLRPSWPPQHGADSVFDQTGPVPLAPPPADDAATPEARPRRLRRWRR